MPGQTPLVVIVAEDDQDSRELLVLALGMAGFEVHGADSLASATALLETVRPDVIIADYSLPDGTGHMLTQHPAARGSICILLTGFDAKTIDASDCAAVLTKPIGPETVVATIRKHVAARG